MPSQSEICIIKIFETNQAMDILFVQQKHEIRNDSHGDML